MFVGLIEFDVLLGDMRSLKQKRGVVRPVLAELHRLKVSATGVADQDLLRRSRIAACLVASDAEYCHTVLDTCESRVAQYPEF
jgi:uncharacterized protein YlxP (DUF503 family)